MPTQIIKIGPGQSAVLPNGARIVSVTEFDGGIATSECPLPTPIGTDTYYWFIDENPATEGDQQFFVTQFNLVNTITNLTEYAIADHSIDNTTPPAQTFVDELKAVPGVIQVRTKNYPGNNNKAFSITVPKGLPIPYFTSYFRNESDPWYFRFYPLTSDDIRYATVVSDLSNPSTIR